VGVSSGSIADLPATSRTLQPYRIAESGRVARLMELDPRYVDVIVRRWQDWTGKSATRENDGVAFNDLAAQRDIDG
jgi:hypothetical protein